MAGANDARVIDVHAHVVLAESFGVIDGLVGDAPLSGLQVPAEVPERAQQRFKDIVSRASAPR